MPIGALLLTGIVLFLLMHFEVKFLQEGRLLFDADRSQRFYVLATVCILSIIVTVGDLFEVYYEHGIASSRETHIYGLLKLFLASCGIAFALFSAASKRFLFRWNWVRETVLVLFMSVAVFLMSSYFSPSEVQKAHTEVNALKALHILEKRNSWHIRTQGLLKLLQMDNAPQTVYISPDGRSLSAVKEKNYMPLTFKTTDHKTCTLCATLQSSKILRKHLHPDHKKAHQTSGDICIFLPDND